jgi:hypothetical protein
MTADTDQSTLAERALTAVHLEVDQLALFDMVAQTGDGGATVGIRLAGLLLGDDSLSTALGLACYGITRASLHDDTVRGEGEKPANQLETGESR